MNIAIIRCNEHAYTCTGAGCVKAFCGNTGYFEQYQGMEKTLVASTDCCGCENFGKEEDGVKNPLFALRLEKLKTQGAEKVHLANCCKPGKCPNFDTIVDMVEDAGFDWERGTHGTK